MAINWTIDAYRCIKGKTWHIPADLPVIATSYSINRLQGEPQNTVRNATFFFVGDFKITFNILILHKGYCGTYPSIKDKEVNMKKHTKDVCMVCLYYLDQRHVADYAAYLFSTPPPQRQEERKKENTTRCLVCENLKVAKRKHCQCTLVSPSFVTYIHTYNLFRSHLTPIPNTLV